MGPKGCAIGMIRGAIGAWHTGGLLAREKGDSRQDVGRGRHDVGFGQAQVRYIGFLGYFTLWRGSNYTSVLVV